MDGRAESEAKKRVRSKSMLLASMECASRSVEDDDQRQVKD